MSILVKINYSSENSFCLSLSNIFNNLDLNDQKIIPFVYDDLFKIRHNIFHFALSKAIFGEYIEEQTIGTYFPKIKHEEMLKTPDIVVLDEKEKICYIIDVTVSIDPDKRVKEKFDKYKTMLKVIANFSEYKPIFKCFQINSKNYDYSKGVLELSFLFKQKKLMIFLLIVP